MPEVGGLSFEQARRLLELVITGNRLVGFDLVEVNPSLDVSQITALLGLQIMVEPPASCSKGNRCHDAPNSDRTEGSVSRARSCASRRSAADFPIAPDAQSMNLPAISFSLSGRAVVPRAKPLKCANERPSRVVTVTCAPSG